MALDSIPGVATAYFRPADRERALELRSMLEEYLGFWNARLGVQLQLRLAVLSPDDWQKVTPLPYAFPNAISPPANLIPAPATPPPTTGIDALFMDGPRRRDWMLIGHEGGHLLTWALLPPDVLALITGAAGGDTAVQRHVRWLNGIPPWFWEYTANYFATAFLQAHYPEDGAAWVRYLETLAAPAERRFSHLEDWFGQLMRARAEDGSPYFLSPEGAPNFGWYQGVVGVLGAHVLAQRGDAVGHIRRVLSSDDVPTTAELLAGVEAIAPGAAALLDSLGAGYRERDDERKGAELRVTRTVERHLRTHHFQERFAAFPPLRGIHPPDAKSEFDAVRNAHGAKERVVPEYETDAALAGRARVRGAPAGAAATAEDLRAARSRRAEGLLASSLQVAPRLVYRGVSCNNTHDVSRGEPPCVHSPLCCAP